VFHAGKNTIYHPQIARMARTGCSQGLRNREKIFYNLLKIKFLKYNHFRVKKILTHNRLAN